METIHIQTPPPQTASTVETTPSSQAAKIAYARLPVATSASWRNIRNVLATTPSHALSRLIDNLDALENLTSLPKSIEYGRQIYFETKRNLYRAHWRGRPDLQRELELDGLHRFALLLHQVNQDPVGTEALLEADNPILNDQMMDALMLAMHEIKDKLSAAEQLAGIQSKDRVRHTLLTRLVTDLLVLKDGTINFGLIPEIRKMIPRVLHDCAGGRHHDPILQGLTHLELNRPLRRTLEKVSADALHPKGEFLIRVSCGLYPSAPVTDRDMRKTLLSALLSRLRQGSVGSCFATAPGVGILAWHPDRALTDFIQMLKQGQLEREAGICPFQVTMAEDDLHDEGDAEYGVFAALHLIGVTDDGVKRWWFNRHSNAFTTPAQVMERIAKEKELHPLQKSLHTMKCAFEAQTHDPLLRAWEGCLATMSHAYKDCLNLKYTLSPLRTKLEELATNCPDAPGDLADQFVETVLSRSHSIFDHALRAQGWMETEEPMGSGFRLFDTHGSKNSDHWRPVKTPDAFRRFLTRAWKELATAIGPEKLAPMMQPVLEAIASDELLIEIVQRAHHSNSGIKDLSNWTQLQRTPWMARKGGFQSRVLRVYFDKDESMGSEKIQPLSVIHLLRRVLDLGRSLPETTKRRLKDRPDLPFLVGTIGHHAFAFTLADPSLLRGWSDQRDPRRWIEEELMAPTRRSAHTIVTPRELTQAIKVIEEKFIRSWNKDDWDEGVSKIPQENLWRCELRNRLATLVAQCRGTQFDSRLRSIDSALFDILPEDEKQDLESRIVTFADTNWYEEAHDVQIGAGPNPWAEELVLWRVCDGEGRNRILDDQKWIHGHKWRFYPFNATSYVPSR